MRHGITRFILAAACIVTLGFPLLGQEPPPPPDPEVRILAPDEAAVVPYTPWYAHGSAELLAWHESMRGQEFIVELPGEQLFQPRILPNMIGSRIARQPAGEPAPEPDLESVFTYDLRLYGPKDRALLWPQLHTAVKSPNRSIISYNAKGEPDDADNSVWTASFRYVPPKILPGAPEVVSTYTFDFSQLRSKDFTFVGRGLVAPGYKAELRPAGPPGCERGQREEPFSDAPPFRLEICVHEPTRLIDKKVGALSYSIVAHHDRSLHVTRVHRREERATSAKPVTFENPATPIEVYDVVFTDADGKEVPHVLDYRALWHWTEQRTLYLSQHGIRELRWVGDLDGPVPALPPAASAP